jgi:hypothetical protein
MRPLGSAISTYDSVEFWEFGQHRRNVVVGEKWLKDRYQEEEVAEVETALGSSCQELTLRLADGHRAA